MLSSARAFRSWSALWLSVAVIGATAGPASAIDVDPPDPGPPVQGVVAEELGEPAPDASLRLPSEPEPTDPAPPPEPVDPPTEGPVEITPVQPPDMTVMPPPGDPSLPPPDHGPGNQPPPEAWRGMTWSVLSQQDGVVRVGYDAQTNPIQGDTPAQTDLPMLCLRVDGRPVPPGVTPTFYDGWAQGEVKLTPPISGAALTSAAVADQVCAFEFGTGWEMAEFHDGYADGQPGGWRWYANGELATESRFWVSINDQNANPWNSNGIQEETVLPSTTKVLGAADRSGLLASNTDGQQLTFASSSPVLAGLGAGDVIASAPTDAAPYGLLRKVATIVPNGERTEVYTEEAALEEAVIDGDIVATATTLDSDDIDYARSGDAIASSEGALRATTQQGVEIDKTIKLLDYHREGFCVYHSQALDCESTKEPKGLKDNLPSGNYMTLSGQFDLEAEAFLKLKIRRLTVKEFESGVAISESANLTAEHVGEVFEWNKDIELKDMRIVFKTFKVNIGPVPVSITPVLMPTVGTHGRIDSKITYQIKQSFGGRYGIRYADGDWDAISAVRRPVAESSASATGNAHVDAYVGAKAMLEFYREPMSDSSLTQLYVHPKAYAAADASITADDPLNAKVCLSAGIKADAGFRLFKIFGKHLWQELLPLQIIDWQRPLGCYAKDKAVTPPGGTAFNSVMLDVTELYGGVEVNRVAADGTLERIGDLSTTGPFDLTPHLDPMGETSIRIKSISKRSTGLFGAHRRNLDIAVIANNSSVPVFDPPSTGLCKGCGSKYIDEFSFTVNKANGTIWPG